jgi:hypothetical protein
MSEESDGASEEPKRQTKQALGIFASVVAAVVGYAVVRVLPFELTTRFLAGALAGCLVGLIPFFIAKRRGHQTLAKLALGICTVCGLILGLLLAVPAGIVFVVIAIARQPEENTASGEQPGPADGEDIAAEP